MFSGLNCFPGFGLQGNEVRNVVVGVGVVGDSQGLKDHLELFVRQQHTHVDTSFK